jgi:prepilin-type N-terminal cleavage/methylation domain-containing protein/prepilin-type processing-associated H-X9-DG protein
VKSLCPSYRRRGLTLIELLVVISIIATLVAMLVPVLASARQQGKKVACLNNLKQLWYATQMWADDNFSHLPPKPSTGGSTGSVASLLNPYMAKASVTWHCPMISGIGRTYSINPQPMGRDVGSITRPSYTIWSADAYVDPDTGNCAELFRESPSSPSASEQGPGQVDYRHNKGAVFLFCDGHVNRETHVSSGQWSP